MAFKKLFEPIRIGKTTIRNRVAMAPMVTQYCDRGYVSEQQKAYYAARARGGVGLIITEAMFTSAWGEALAPLTIAGMYDFGHMPGMGDLVETIHAFGSKVFVQLNIGLGPQGSARRTGVQPMAPSPLGYVANPDLLPRNMAGPGFDAYMIGEMPREMTVEEIEREQDAFVNSARLACAVGFDGLEIHAANGFLLHSFLSPRFNRRGDRYGGSVDNRMRFLVELIRKLRAALGDAMAIGVRTSIDEYVEGGITMEDSKIIVPKLAAEGIDYFHVSEGTFESLVRTIPDEPDTMLEKAALLRGLVDIPIVTPSVYDPHLAEKAIGEGGTDMVALGRQLIADPDWANKVKAGRLDEIRACDRCNRGCFARIFQGLRVKCVQNPESGLERYNPAYTQWAARQKGIEQRAAAALAS